MNNYKKYMNSMSRTELITYLGQDIENLVVEWCPNGNVMLTNQRMISMIDSLYGTSILKNKDFRKSLLQKLKERDIFQIRDDCLEGTEKKENNPLKIIEFIVSKPWNKNKVSVYLAKLWGLTEDIFDKERDDAVIENDISSQSEPFYELLDYQYYIKQRVLANLNSGHQLERMLIHMPTGTGKTKTSMHIISNYLNFTLQKNGAVIWVAHTTELLQQAYDTFSEVWGHLGDGIIKAYKLWGTRSIEVSDKPITGIVFCGLKKLMSIYDSDKNLFERLKKDCRLIVFDEAHKAAATKTKKVIDLLMMMPQGYENRALLGLTATPGRKTDSSYDNNLLSNMFGNKLINIDSSILNQINYGPKQSLNVVPENNIIKYFQEKRILAKMRPERLKYEKSFTEKELQVLRGALVDLGYNEKEYTSEQIKILACNKDRNLAILTKIRIIHQAKLPVIVFACSVTHAKMLSAMLTLEGINNSLVLGDMDPIDRKTAINKFKDKGSGVDIIINYEVLTTGFDSKNIKCVFITRPTKSVVLYSQMLGRGLRGPLMGGNEECLLVDIDDNLDAFDNETAFSYFNDYWRV